MLPVIVISGYLGAGKTSLISDFLKDPQGLRATVLVNDFGPINLDAELIAETGADTIALTNGCACCSIGDDLLGAAQRAAAADPDLLIVEASGVAQPARISQLLHGVVGTGPVRSLAVVNLSRAAQLARDKFVGRLFHQQIEQVQALAFNRGVLPDSGPLQQLLNSRPRVGSLRDLLTAEGGALAPVTRTDEAKGAEFLQSTLKPDAMSETELRDWLAKLSPTPHRAKGRVPIRMSDGSIRMQWLDFVQGQISLGDLPYPSDAAAAQLVVIAPKVVRYSGDRDQ